jgi:hypothetical protein
MNFDYLILECDDSGTLITLGGAPLPADAPDDQGFLYWYTDNLNYRVVKHLRTREAPHSGAIYTFLLERLVPQEAP